MKIILGYYEVEILSSVLPLSMTLSEIKEFNTYQKLIQKNINEFNNVSSWNGSVG